MPSVAHDNTLVGESVTSLEQKRETDPATRVDDVGEMTNEVSSLKDALEEQMRDISSQVAMVQKELQRLQMDSLAQIEHLEDSLPSEILEEESRRKHARSAGNPQSALQSKPRRREASRRVSWSPDVQDNAKRPGDMSLSDMSRRRMRMNRQMRAQQADTNSVLQTTFYCILVVILSKVIPHFLEFMQDINDEQNDDHSWTTSSSFDD